MIYYVVQVNSYQLVRQQNYEYKEVFIESRNEKKAKTKEQMMEILKEMLVNEIYITENGGKFNKLTLFNDDSGCIMESKYIIAYQPILKIDRVFIKCTDHKSPITDNDMTLKGISYSDYRYFTHQLKMFLKTIKYNRGGEKVVLCS